MISTAQLTIIDKRTKQKNELGSNQDTDLDPARDDARKPNVEIKTVEENPLAASSSIE